MTRLAGHVAVVTGANRGIGLGLAEGLVLAGATVAVWARDAARNAAACDHLDALAAEHGTGGGALPLTCDVGDEEQVAAAMAGTLGELGKVDSLFANAGVGGLAPFVEMTLDEWRRVMAVNLDGAFLTLREAARHLVARGEGGALVVVSSVSAIHGAPRQEHYAASKAAVLALMRGLAVELARHRVRCNALLPGWTDTEMLEGGKDNQRWVDATVRRTPVRRWGAPSDFREVAAYLADPALMFHTGDSIVIDGGYSVF
ncbi:MAG TPA: SDR family NAD(P)-dependent oxidoreductase [Acidimicrobiales bacterium]|nr:SDR family NAD(P)-dependent oxidoreductase [Acidimicrobiales bacterium]